MLPIIFSLVLGITHFWNEKITIPSPVWRTRAASFIAGVSVAYLFLIILPELFDEAKRADQVIFVSLLTGFTLLFSIEKYITKETPKNSLKENLSSLHALSFFIYHFLLGVTLVEISRLGLFKSTLFFIPILFYSGVGLISLEKISGRLTASLPVRVILASSSLLGVVFAEYIFQFQQLFAVLFGIVIGAFLYVVLLDFVPKESSGSPVYFTIGIFIYSLLILLVI